MPFPASITTFNGRSAFTSTKDSTCFTNSGMRLRRVICPSRGGRGNSPLATISLMSFIPLSLPTGRAPARTIFIPLYLDGLCDAVNTTPGISSEPDA